ncbi:hypothetical protein LEMLEM_LOCUS21761 [Lemmus lemmus]
MVAPNIQIAEANMSDQNPERHILGLHHLVFCTPQSKQVLKHSVTMRTGESRRQVKGVRGSSRQKEMIPTLFLEECLHQRPTLVPTRPACSRAGVTLVSEGSGAAVIPTSRCLRRQMDLCFNLLEEDMV